MTSSRLQQIGLRLERTLFRQAGLGSLAFAPAYFY